MALGTGGNPTPADLYVGAKGAGGRTYSSNADSSSDIPDLTKAQQFANQQANAQDFFGSVFGYDPTTGRTIAGQNAVTGYENQIGMQLGSRDYQSGLLWEGTGDKIAGLNLKRQGNALDAQLAQQAAQDAAARLGLAGRGRDLTKEEAWWNARTNQEGLLSDAGARGGVVATEGVRHGFRDIQGALSRSLRGADITYEGAALDARQAKAQAQARQQQAALQAKQYDLDEQGFGRALKQGLEKLNLDTYVSVDDLMDKINSSDAQDRQTADQIIRNAMQFSGQFPTYRVLPPAMAHAAPTVRSGQGYRQ